MKETWHPVNEEDQQYMTGNQRIRQEIIGTTDLESQLPQHLIPQPVFFGDLSKQECERPSLIGSLGKLVLIVKLKVQVTQAKLTFTSN